MIWCFVAGAPLSLEFPALQLVNKCRCWSCALHSNTVIKEGVCVCSEQRAERCGKRVERYEGKKELGCTTKEEPKDTV